MNIEDRLKLVKPIQGGAPTPEEEVAAAAKAAEDAAAAAKVAPTGVTREEFTASQAQFAETLRGVSTTLEQVRTAIAQPRTVERVTPAAEITPEQYDEAIRIGDGPTARLFIDQERAKDRAVFEQRVGQVESAGTDSLAGVVELTAVATLPYYKTYEKEIKEIIKSMPALGRINPGAQRKAYDMVIGGHVEEIAAAEREKASRAASDPANAGRPGASGLQRAPAGGGSASPDTPSPRDLGGEEAESALVLVGRDADRTAQGMGYKNWSDYMEKTKGYR